VGLHPTNVIRRINETERIGLVSRHDNLVLALEVGEKSIDSFRAGRGCIILIPTFQHGQDLKLDVLQELFQFYSRDYVSMSTRRVNCRTAWLTNERSTESKKIATNNHPPRRKNMLTMTLSEIDRLHQGVQVEVSRLWFRG
jgi:hypothetical protein